MTKPDWMAGAALAMAIVGTASAEYHLAVAAGWGQVAFALPGCLDIYALRALRAHRDMLAVLAALIVVNSVSHLIAVGLLAPSVWVVIGVSSIAPAVLWRVHALRDEAAEPEAEPMDDHFRTAAELTEVPPEPAPEPVTLERVPEVSETPTPAAPWPLLGPMTPVAELLAGTGREQGGRLAPVPSGTPAEQPEPEPEVPEPDPEPQARSDDPDPVPPGVALEHVEAAREWLATNPELTGTAIGTKLGKSDGYGRRVKRAVLGATT